MIEFQQNDLALAAPDNIAKVAIYFDAFFKPQPDSLILFNS
jgi:hypothetical protein